MESQIGIHHFGLWVLAALVSLVGIVFVRFSLLLIGAALFEKHPIQALTGIATDLAPVLSSYATEMNAQLPRRASATAAQQRSAAHAMHMRGETRPARK